MQKWLPTIVTMIVTGLGLLTGVIQAAYAAHPDLALVVTGLYAIIKGLLPSPIAAPSGPSTGARLAGTGALHVVALLALGSCATLASSGVGQAVVDCTEAVVVENVAKLEPFALQLIEALTSANGTVDWASFGRALAGLGAIDGECLLNDLALKLTAQPPRADMVTSAMVTQLGQMARTHWPGVKIGRAPGGVRLP
jgi:hypothetical protein